MQARPDLDAACGTIWVEISTEKEKPLITDIGSHYRPPSVTLQCDTSSVLEGSLQKIEYPLRKHVLLCGDFNLREINWSTSSVKYDSEVGNRLMKLAQNHDLIQMVKIQTRTTEMTSSTIDLVFTHQPEMISTVSVIPGFSNNVAFTACIHIKLKYTRYNSRKISFYNKAKYQSMKAGMSTFSSSCFESAPERNTFDYIIIITSNLFTHSRSQPYRLIRGAV